MVKCEVCGKEIDESHERFRVQIGEETHHFCSLECLSKSHPIRNLSRRNLSGLVLNKTFFELFAIVTGILGLYYTLFMIENRALIMDTFSVITGIAALTIGIEHLR